MSKHLFELLSLPFVETFCRRKRGNSDAAELTHIKLAVKKQKLHKEPTFVSLKEPVFCKSPLYLAEQQFEFYSKVTASSRCSAYFPKLTLDDFLKLDRLSEKLDKSHLQKIAKYAKVNQIHDFELVFSIQDLAKQVEEKGRVLAKIKDMIFLVDFSRSIFIFLDFFKRRLIGKMVFEEFIKLMDSNKGRDDDCSEFDKETLNQTMDEEWKFFARENLEDRLWVEACYYLKFGDEFFLGCSTMEDAWVQKCGFTLELN